MSATAPTPACPICGKPVETPAARPFCSPRCKRVDLNRWLGEVYRIPVEDGDAASDDAPDDRD